MFARRATFSVLIILTLVVAGPGQSSAQKPVQNSVAQKASLEDLAWLSGCWEGRQGQAIVEEIWSKPAGGSMLGLGRTVKENRTVSYEFMQFREENGSLVFLPQPQGGTRVAFPLKDSFGGRLTFENKEHDFPQRVIYEPKGALLLAAIEGTYKGKQEREEYQMRKVRCNPKDE
ncbi:MAG TPA: DUF6265 family protein [Pyrinomonadaceae bacterium]|jgi:hypothetical protein|nr:DUF6265 family protein [Pyrinomonadaceae bacterium]